MRTLIEFKDGHTEVVEDAGPNVYEGEVSFIGADAEVMADDVPLSRVKRIIFVHEGEFYE